MAQFDVYSTSVENIISWIKSGDRFFLDAAKVHNHMSSFLTPNSKLQYLDSSGYSASLRYVKGTIPSLPLLHMLHHL